MQITLNAPPVPEREAWIADSVCLRAFELWEECGCPSCGSELDEWFEAVRDLKS